MDTDFSGFLIERFEPDQGMMIFAERVAGRQEEDIEITAFMAYWSAEDLKRKVEPEIVSVKAGKRVTLPRSVDGNCAKVYFAGATPQFEALNADLNLVAQVPSSSVIRVEFKGKRTDRSKKALYFKAG